MKLDFLDKIALTFFAIWIGFTVNAHAGEWNDKPVMCEQKDIALKVVKDKGEVPLFTGIQTTKVYGKDGLSTIPVHIPIQLFVNFKTKNVHNFPSTLICFTILLIQN